MIKFLIIIIFHLFILLNIQCSGKIIKVEAKIKNDWEEKREFIYLKNVELKERFVLKTNEKKNNRFDGFNKNIEGYLRLNEFNPAKNIFKTEIKSTSEYSPTEQLKRKIVIEIANNQKIQNVLPEFKKRVPYIMY